jgi:hypothetical protein
LKDLLLKALAANDAIVGKSDMYGQRYIVNLKISNFDKEAMVVTAWIILNDENYARLTTCFVKK